MIVQLSFYLPIIQ